MILKKLTIKGLCIVCFLWILGICHVLAVTTTIWEQNSHKDFSSGKPKDVSITSKNEVTLSRSLLSIDSSISELRIWCLAQDSQGNLYAGTGDKGKIFKIAKDDKVSLLFDSPETDILSLVVDSSDNLYAGTSPDGLIYRVKPAGVPETFFNSGEKYVWSLAFDSTGNLYAGTGINGKLYKISPDGKGEVVYDSGDAHIKCVLRSGDSIYAGSEGSGIIYRVSADGKVFVLYDTSEREVSCMAVDARGNLYAAAVSGEAGPSREPEQAPPGPPSRERERAERKSVIYQITPDGVVMQIWRSPDPLIFSIIVDGENLMVGTGDEGKIYSVNPNGDWALMADCAESQVLSLYKAGDGGEIRLATGNPAKLYKLSSSYVKEGTLESQKCDASVTSKWGSISWDAVQPEGTSVTLSTRSGNTEKPDDTWSKWSEEYTNSSGEAITNPPARFVQWRAKLTSAGGTATPVLKSVSIAYLQTNLKPTITSVTIASEQEKGGGQPMRPPDRGSDEEAQPQSDNTPVSGKKIIKWQAKDPNNDSLEYAIYFRGVEERNWKLLKKEVKTNSYPLDSESFPDGKYLIKVVASDSPSNPADTALSEEEISEPFVVDNTPPKVEVQAKYAGDGRYVVTGKVDDATSIIKSIVYSVDGGNWKPAFPSNQIFDSRVENFSFPTESLTEGEHTIVIKATDAADNTGAAKTVIPAK